jgi:hypothetical protein
MSFHFLPGVKPEIEVHFHFQHTARGRKRTKSTATGQPSHDGTVYYRLMINGVECGGAQSTGIKTFHAYYLGRADAQPTPKAKALTRQLLEFEMLVEYVHGELSKRGGVITGEAIAKGVKWLKVTNGAQPERLLSAAYDSGNPFEIVTLPRVYREFMEAKKNTIEPVIEKRKDGQISPNTYDSYPKRWAMIFGYLDSQKKTNYPVLNVDYPFATNLKEFFRQLKKDNGDPYETSTINKGISFLKMLLKYAQEKGYIQQNPLVSFSCRGGSPANPKPLTEAHLQQLEACELTPYLRQLCDSWLLAAELCLHHADFMNLPNTKFIERTSTEGITKRFIQHNRRKQPGGAGQQQTIDITPRAERILQKYGVANLCYRHSGVYAKYLKIIAQKADLRDENGDLIGLQFGQGRDTGLTHRVIDGANAMQLSKIAGWSKPVYANRYIGDSIGVVEAFAFARSPKEPFCLN